VGPFGWRRKGATASPETVWLRGAWGIRPRVLEEAGDVTAGPRSIICQRSWEAGGVPADWELANVTPVYQKGMRGDPRNYRPVRLTSLPGKNYGKGHTGFY